MSDPTTTRPKDGGPAFPCAIQTQVDWTLKGSDRVLKTDTEIHPYSGMALRDYFAAKAMQGMHANSAPEFLRMKTDECARLAYEQADAMLKAREVSRD